MIYDNNLALTFQIILKHFFHNIALYIKHFTNSFNISLYALFVAILVPAIKESKQIALLVLITAVLNIFLSPVLGNWSLIVSTLVGAAVGMYIVDDEYLLSGDE